jgi:hypothetical protein
MKRTVYFIAGLLFLVFSSVGFQYPSHKISSLVNIYLYDTLLLTADENNGINVYSVADRQNPAYRMSIPLPGVRGMAMKGNIVYAGSWRGIFTYRLNWDGYDALDTIYRYKGEDIVIDRSVNSPWSCGCYPLSTPIASDGGTSGGGSYAVFAVIDTFLYYIDYSALVTMSIAAPEKPRELARTEIGWTIETLYPTDRYLFIGGTRGMYIMDKTDEARPRLIGSLLHARGCDPVVVRDTFAYVTLRKGNSCGDAADELLTVSIADPKVPKLLKEFAVETPYGLSVRDSLLYISNGYGGYGLFSARDPYSVTLLKRWIDAPTRDFIWRDSTLYIMGFMSVSLMDVANPERPAPISVIE